MATDLFGVEAPDDKPVPPAPFYDVPEWNRIVELKKPPCGHCQMAAHAKLAIAGVLRAVWQRIGREGGVLALCEQHAAEQRKRDEAEGVARKGLTGVLRQLDEDLWGEARRIRQKRWPEEVSLSYVEGWEDAAGTFASWIQRYTR